MVVTVLAPACGRCGAPPAAGGPCPRCGCPPVPPRADPAAPLRDVSTARPARIALGVVVDALVVAAPALGLWAQLAADPVTRRTGAAAVLAVATAIVLLLVTSGLVLTAGRGLGGLLTGLRLVDSGTGQPVRPGRWARRLAGGARPGLVWCAVRGGRDPARTGLVGPLTIDTVGPAADVSYPAAYTQRVSFVSLRLGDGRSVKVEDALVVGRDPDPDAGPGELACAVLAWPDLSRRLARSHLLLEREGWSLWATSLAGATTVLSADASRAHLEPGQRTRLGPGDVLRIGGRTMTVLGAAS